MFQIQISNTLVIFSKFFSASDAATAIEVIPVGTTCVLFVDTGVTPDLAATTKSLVEQGTSVTIRDHHKGEGRNPESAEAIEQILGNNAKIVDRKTAPGCATLITLGEFSDIEVIVADPDYDGLVAAMKACGITYEGMDNCLLYTSRCV